MAEQEKVAILGGGVASIVAAYELTRPELDDRYDVTVYQLGWRLGGKCASGRNAAHGQRIEEHGLHIWFGFYENAFRVMREVYEELGRDPDAPLATWRDAFKPCDDIVLYEHYANRWRGWSFEVPRNPLTPGDGEDLPHFWEIAHTMLDYLLGRWGALKATHLRSAPKAPSALLPFGLDRLTLGLDRVAVDLLRGLLRRAQRAPEEAMFAALSLAERRKLAPTDGDRELDDRSLLWEALDLFKRWLWRDVVEPRADEDDDLRFFFTMFDAGTTILQGIVADGLIERGFDVVNDEDLREWLRRHGAQEITIGEGPFVRALYDMAFAYEDGDIRRPNMAAGTALHDMLRLFFTYRGAFTWKMQAGMGDTVFTPFYEVLRRRGVRFEFFHCVSRLGLSADTRPPRLVEEIDVIQQVELRDPPYRPLVDVDDLPCWPSEPRWNQIVDGDVLRERGVNLEWEHNPLRRPPRTLRRGEDFDRVVLGISVGALPPICRELADDRTNPRFRAMLENSHTVMTQAFQLWLNRPLDRLGWRYHGNSIMTGYVEPLDTYANMSHLIPRETWPPRARVENVGYFCGVIEDRPGDTQQSANKRVRANAARYLRRHARGIWPDATGRRGSGFDWSYLVDQRRAEGESRLDSQFWLANFQPTERYVLTPKGSVKWRLTADESGYDNLILAGDWIKNGLDAGCVEAAVMGGMQAARAISGLPAKIFGEDHGWLAAGGTAAAADGRRAPAPLPQYVNYGGLATCPSPVTCDGATLYCFFLEGDHDLLAALCDRVFAQPSDGAVRLRPLGRHVMLSFGIVDKIESELSPWHEMGYATERQVAFWIPVISVERRDGRDVAVSLAWFVPYMWVDNPLSLAGGREIYGFNKNWGWIALPHGDAVDRLTLSAYGGDFGGGRPAGRHRLIEVGRVVAGPVKRGAPRWQGLDELVDDVRDLLRVLHADDVLELPEEIFEEIARRGGPPQIFLKQFRSVADGERASEQQITDGTVTVKRISGRPLLSEFEFKLHRLDSHPIAAELGVEDQTTSLAFELQMDFVLEDGRVLWEAAAHA